MPANPPQKTDLTTDFDLDSLRLKQDFNETLGVQKMLTHVPVRKPNKADFFRVRPDEEYRMEVGIVEMKDTRETFLVTPAMMSQPGVHELVVPARLVTCVTRQNVLFLWPLKLGKDGKLNPWHESALEAAKLAKSSWTRIAADMNLGAYQPFIATAELPEPEWPEYTFSELVRLGFKGLIVDKPDHPLIQQLTGAV
jgi:hypothetical protein